MTRQPKIDEIVAFLEKNNPQTLEQLQIENPSYTHIMKPGEVLGSSADIEELKARAKVCFASTDAVIQICNQKLPIIKSKLKGTQKIQLWGQIITTICGASVITTLATKHTNITYIAGGLSLLAALVPLIVDQRNRGIDKQKQLDETYITLVKLSLEAERNKQELKFFIDNDFNVEGISSVINRCNAICSEIMERQLLS